MNLQIRFSLCRQAKIWKPCFIFKKQNLLLSLRAQQLGFTNHHKSRLLFFQQLPYIIKANLLYCVLKCSVTSRICGFEGEQSKIKSIWGGKKAQATNRRHNSVKSRSKPIPPPQMADSGALRTRIGVGYFIYSPPCTGSLDKPSSSFELSPT